MAEKFGYANEQEDEKNTESHETEEIDDDSDGTETAPVFHLIAYFLWKFQQYLQDSLSTLAHNIKYDCEITESIVKEQFPDIPYAKAL